MVKILLCFTSARSSCNSLISIIGPRIFFLLTLYFIFFVFLLVIFFLVQSYGRAIDLEDTKILALIESGNIHMMLGSFRQESCCPPCFNHLI